MTHNIFSTRFRYIVRNCYLRIGIAACGLGFLFFFWSYFIYYRQWEMTMNGYISQQNELRKHIRYLKQNAKSVEQYDAALGTIKALEDRLKSAATQVAIAEQVNALARQSGVNIDASTFKTEVQDDGVKKSHQEIALNGSYTRLRDFIIGLSQLSTLTVPSEILIQKTSAESTDVSARIHLVSYQIQNQGSEVE